MATVFRSKTPIFPPPSRYVFPPASTGRGPNGVVCTGADFAPGTLLAAYGNGIFPWPVSEDLVPWCSPAERALLFLDPAPTWSRSVRRARKKPFRVTFDQAFSEVVESCKRLREDGTWILPGLVSGMLVLHQLGWAHSVEVWNEADELVGGLYGLAIGASFAGESMFHVETDASKVAFATLADALSSAGYHFLDGQVLTSHLASLGCVAVRRAEFSRRLAEAVRTEVVFPDAP